ncbi:hypothetical protein A8L45_16735 [Veronia pacifica]|uniref:MotA/TolQ/ExbB proton channel domain-containing protein n=2 Tax=Veronia pacifica TaxID=1080227 RepID=A0A1C3EEC5_9GAMM|nr:MotA/TolQ/ExbB proton channel family protein [Veronia pacifica]ODA31544.1 hypothetical protein A8L45_16735 [Veronia pacifica]
MDVAQIFSNFIDHWFHTTESFMDAGGPVLWWLASVAAIMWCLMIERFLYVNITFPKERQRWVAAWRHRSHCCSWSSIAIRDGWLFQAQLKLNQRLMLIKGLITICPMLGLLGTVTGMIAVFDVMANQGNSDVRSMAGGIAMATFPTLGGMVIALTGLFAHSRLVKACLRRELSLEKELRTMR